jgi:FAD/FMN-containing dehydrogenase
LSCCVLSLEYLNNIGNIKENTDNTAFITVAAEVRINDIIIKAYQHGCMYPPDPTEKNSGNITTNASGARGFKY